MMSRRAAFVIAVVVPAGGAAVLGVLTAWWVPVIAIGTTAALFLWGVAMTTLTNGTGEAK